MEEFDLPHRIQFAPYNQVFHQLLDPASLLVQNKQGINVVLLRLEDFAPGSAASQPPAGVPEALREEFRKTIDEFLNAVQTASARSAVPMLVGVCPPTPELGSAADWRRLFEQGESTLVSELSKQTGVEVITAADLVGRHPLADYYDQDADRLGHIPYTPLFYTTLGTQIARKIYALQAVPHKVVVLDCDQTLWQGICGEDGPRGIALDPPRRVLHDFIIAQHAAGMLVCLCSKNNEEDVAEVFRLRADFPLRREHFVSWRVNWQPKSENIRSLADELQVGLSSIIFIDDDLLECAEVETNCPEVLTLQLPENRETIPAFLRGIWAFDRRQATAEDKNRTALYRQNEQRAGIRQRASNLADFMASLRLNIEIGEPSVEELGRVSQLTFRTNQFNTTTIRRAEKEIQDLFLSRALEFLTVKVSDRFGDYGLVGAVLYKPGLSALYVDSFLVSCRALGRGVEQHVLARLGQLAVARGFETVDIPFNPTGRNMPAQRLLEQLGTEHRNPAGEGFVFRFPAKMLADIDVRVPLVMADAEAMAARPLPSPAEPALRNSSERNLPRKLRQIAEELSDSERVLAAIETRRRVARDLATAALAPRTPMEETIATMWAEVMGIANVGVTDQFFALGGNSLLMTSLGDLMLKIKPSQLYDLPSKSCHHISREYRAPQRNNMNINS